VLNTSSGSCGTVGTPPSAAAAPGSLGAVSDPATGDVLVYDAGHMSGPSFLIRLATRTVAWAQQPGQTSLLPISVHDGNIYGLQFGRSGTPLSVQTVRESDGAITDSGYQIAPVASPPTAQACSSRPPHRRN